MNRHCIGRVSVVASCLCLVLSARALDWSGGTLTLLPDGTQAVVWRHAASSGLSRSFAEPADWSGYGTLRFRLHSAAATGSAFMVILPSENAAEEGLDYYSFKIVLDWTGWKQFEIPLRELGSARSPIGWHHIDDEAAALDPDSLRVNTHSQGKANVHILPAATAGLTARIAKGEEDPVQGWANGPWRPVPTAVYSLEAAGKARVVSLVYPTPPDAPCPVTRVEQRADQQGVVTVTVTFANGRQDVCVFAADAAAAPQPCTLTRKENAK